MTNGCVRPSTSLLLGLATKSITGSRKIIDILNRMGFCISYTAIEEIETELAYGISVQNHILPYGMEPNCEGLRTHVAFDNFDKFVETVNGKDTLHDTVGIVYQNVRDETNAHLPKIANIDSNLRDENSNYTKSRRRKYYSNFDDTVQPYTKGNGPGACLFGSKPIHPLHLQDADIFDNIWMFNHAFGTSGAKRWFVWNAERISDKNPIQKIGYLPNINMSPTSDATVKKTLEIALDIAKECNQKSIIVSYDLAIASKAYRIQMDLGPMFDGVFINMGAFHTHLSYFKVRMFVST